MSNRRQGINGLEAVCLTFRERNLSTHEGQIHFFCLIQYRGGGDGYCRPKVEGNGLWRILPRANTARAVVKQFEVRQFWAPILCRGPWHKFDSIRECCEANYCFACGAEYPSLDGAHIIPIWAGGSNHPSNVHLLCSGCHALSECVGGLAYWRWFRWWRMGKMLRYWSGDEMIAAEVKRLLHR